MFEESKKYGPFLVPANGFLWRDAPHDIFAMRCETVTRTEQQIAALQQAFKRLSHVRR